MRLIPFLPLIPLTLVHGVALAQSNVYRCPQANGSVTLSDKPCPGGDVREGNNWISLQEIERRRAEDAERARKAATERRTREAAETEARENESRAQLERQVTTGESRPSRRAEPSAAAVDRMTTYSVVLGRAIGCGIDMQPQLKRVGAWFDSEFPLGPSKTTYMAIMAEGMKQHAQSQRSGSSPDSCATVSKQIGRFPWP